MEKKRRNKQINKQTSKMNKEIFQQTDEQSHKQIQKERENGSQTMKSIKIKPGKQKRSPYMATSSHKTCSLL